VEKDLIFTQAWSELAQVKIMQCTNLFVTIATVNFQNIVSFYTNLLEQSPINLIPNAYAEFQIYRLQLGIFKVKKNHKLEFEKTSAGQMSLCLEVTNLETAINHLSSLGYPPTGTISLDSHGREIYAYDPDGNRLILYQGNRDIKF